MKKWIIITFGLKGSWSWAKHQMLKGRIVRCKHWTGTLKLCIDTPENALLRRTFSRDLEDAVWEDATHHLTREQHTDYEVVHPKLNIIAKW